MTLEVEAKLRVDVHGPVRDRLLEVGAEFVRDSVETNWLFDLPDGGLRGKGVGLRVRSVSVERGEPAAATMTVKGPRVDSELKVREELETAISDPMQACAMLKTLGYVCTLEYSKRRESWRYQHCQIELDTPPHIGCFVEIEGPDESTVRKVQDGLGLGGVPIENNSYVRLLVSYCNEHGMPTDHLSST